MNNKRLQFIENVFNRLVDMSIFMEKKMALSTDIDSFQSMRDLYGDIEEIKGQFQMEYLIEKSK